MKGIQFTQLDLLTLGVSQIKKLNAHIPHFDALDRDKERPPKKDDRWQNQIVFDISQCSNLLD